MRISEALRLRVKDIDFSNHLIEIHSSKGGKSRIVPLPEELIEPLRRAVESRRSLHDHDVADGIASVWLPHALARKYPNAAGQLHRTDDARDPLRSEPSPMTIPAKYRKWTRINRS